MSCKFSPSSAKFGPSLRAFTPFDYQYFGTDPRVFGIRRSDLVVSPKLKPAIMNNSKVEVCWRMQNRKKDDCSSDITKSYLWKKNAINSVDSVVMVMNSGMIFSSASLSNSYKYKWRLLIVIAGYLIYLARKMIFVLRRSSFVNEYEVMIPLANHAMVAFLEILIFIALFFIFLFDQVLAMFL